LENSYYNALYCQNQKSFFIKKIVGVDFLLLMRYIIDGYLERLQKVLQKIKLWILCMLEFAKHIGKINVKGGLAHCICYVLIFVVLSIFGIVYCFPSLITGIVGMVVILLIVGVFLWRLMNLCEKNPHVAIMSGTEYLLYEHIQNSQKSGIEISNNISDLIPSGEINPALVDTISDTPEDINFLQDDKCASSHEVQK